MRVGWEYQVCRSSAPVSVSRGCIGELTVFTLALADVELDLALRLSECQASSKLVVYEILCCLTDPRDGRTERTNLRKKGSTSMAINIKPLEDRIVIKQVEAERTTASGLVIPDTAKEKPQEGEVLAVGPGRVDDNGNRIPLDVKVGDVVIYSRFGGTEVKYAGEEYQILSARDVLAVVER